MQNEEFHMRVMDLNEMVNQEVTIDLMVASGSFEDNIKNFKLNKSKWCYYGFRAKDVDNSIVKLILFICLMLVSLQYLIETFNNCI